MSRKKTIAKKREMGVVLSEESFSGGGKKGGMGSLAKKRESGKKLRHREKKTTPVGLPIGKKR